VLETRAVTRDCCPPQPRRRQANIMKGNFRRHRMLDRRQGICSQALAGCFTFFLLVGIDPSALEVYFSAIYELTD
jgi:hypothetical protein